MSVLPNDYEPRIGDMRSESLIDSSGLFKVDVYTGTWKALHNVTSDEIGVLRAGAPVLGYRKSETGALAYYWHNEPKAGAAWWTCEKNEINRAWHAPRYSLGDLVWTRGDLAGQPLTITGIDLVEAWNDPGSLSGEDEDLSSPQTWQYHFQNHSAVTEEYLLGRSELITALQHTPEPVTPPPSDFDPFLDLDS